MKQQGQDVGGMTWTKFNPGKEKPAAKNVCAITKEGRAQKWECLNGRKGQEGFLWGQVGDLKSEILVVGQKKSLSTHLGAWV